MKHCRDLGENVLPEVTSALVNGDCLMQYKKGMIKLAIQLEQDLLVAVNKRFVVHTVFIFTHSCSCSQNNVAVCSLIKIHVNLDKVIFHLLKFSSNFWFHYS